MTQFIPFLIVSIQTKLDDTFAANFLNIYRFIINFLEIIAETCQRIVIDLYRYDNECTTTYSHVIVEFIVNRICC